MMQIGLIGIGAGAAAALLFASVASGSWLSIILFYLAPLPVMIAGLGWSHWAALIAAFTGARRARARVRRLFLLRLSRRRRTAGLVARLSRHAGAAGRPRATARAPALEWYPPGRLVVVGRGLGALTVIVAIPNFGLDGETIRANLHSALAQLLRLETGSGARRRGDSRASPTPSG